MKTIQLGTLFLATLFIEPMAAQASLYDLTDSPYATFIARRPGDLLTVIVDEDASTGDNGERKHDRSSSLFAQLTQFFIPRLDMREGMTGTAGTGDPGEIEFESSSEWKAKSENSSDHTFETRLQVQLVEEVSPGNFIIRGIRKINLNGKEKDLYISGVIRQRDITTSNTIFSHQIADATVEIDGDAGGTDVREGLFHKAFNLLF